MLLLLLLLSIVLLYDDVDDGRVLLSVSSGMHAASTKVKYTVLFMKHQLMDTNTEAMVCLSELMSICSDYAPCSIQIRLSEVATAPIVSIECDKSRVSTYKYWLPSACNPYTIVSTWHLHKDEQSYTNSIAALILAKAVLTAQARYHILVQCYKTVPDQAALRLRLQQAPNITRHHAILLCNNAYTTISV